MFHVLFLLTTPILSLAHADIYYDVDAPVHAWDFNGNSATDDYGSNDGTVIGSSPTWVTGLTSTALHYDGPHDDPAYYPYTDIAHPDNVWVDLGSIDHEIPGAMVVWFNGEDVSASWASLVDGQHMRLGVSSGYLQGWICDDATGTFYPTAPTALSDDEWYRAVMTWDTTSVRLYLNGVQEIEESWSGTLSSTNSDYGIGADWVQGATYNFLGTIDEVALFDRDLAQREITLLYDAGLLNWADDRHDDVLDTISAMASTAFADSGQQDELYTRAERVRTMMELAIDITNAPVRHHMVQGARLYLMRQIQARADGCASGSGTPDSNDWVQDCSEQQALNEAIEAVLEPLNRM